MVKILVTGSDGRFGKILRKVKTKYKFIFKDKKSLWSGQNLHNLYKKAHTPWEWHKTIFERAKSKNKSSQFDQRGSDKMCCSIIARNFIKY